MQTYTKWTNAQNTNNRLLIIILILYVDPIRLIMSETPPKDKDPVTPPIKPVARDFKIMIEDTKLDVDTKAALLAMGTQNEAMAKTIQEMNTREQLGLRDKAVDELLKELGDIRPDLVEDFKDEKDLGVLKNAIKVAKKLTSKYRDIALDDKGKEIKPPVVFTSIDPITGELRADTA